MRFNRDKKSENVRSNVFWTLEQKCVWAESGVSQFELMKQSQDKQQRCM